ncbi:MAG TPA: SigE family RNA polymerase sigma factor [Mycobacteriales bacterium]|nr:SigE family RNA polymerase sigma factor [Mycobacteriales bacterium]HET7326526.1 SigE family RNA polymerase sigma factor [Nocardioidaceae bacterium]
MDAGAEEAFRQFVLSRSPGLRRLAVLLTGDYGHAEDLVQVALTKLYFAWNRLEAQEAVDAYARRILVNTHLNQRRRRWWRERATPTIPDAGVADAADETAERDRVLRALAALPARQRAVMVLRFYDDKSEADVARILQIPLGTVKSSSARALARLEGLLAAQAEEPRLGVGDQR